MRRLDSPSSSLLKRACSIGLARASVIGCSRPGTSSIWSMTSSGVWLRPVGEDGWRGRLHTHAGQPLRRVPRRDACSGTVQHAHSHRTDLTRLAADPFTTRVMRRDLLIGIVIVVLIERARMRPGG